MRTTMRVTNPFRCPVDVAAPAWGDVEEPLLPACQVVRTTLGFLALTVLVLLFD